MKNARETFLAQNLASTFILLPCSLHISKKKIKKNHVDFSLLGKLYGFPILHFSMNFSSLYICGKVKIAPKSD